MKRITGSDLRVRLMEVNVYGVAQMTMMDCRETEEESRITVEEYNSDTCSGSTELNRSDTKWRLSLSLSSVGTNQEL